MTGKRRFLDIYRLTAMLLVMWGHLVGTGMYAHEIPCVIQGTMETTIVSSAGNCLAYIDGFFYNHLHTQCAILGVSMFFIGTGFLVPSMLKRYTRGEFLVNRALRILPPLWVCIAVVGILVYLSQGIAFSAREFITSALLLTRFFHALPVLGGIVWTLQIEVLFYLYTAAWGKVDGNTILTGYGLTILTGTLYYEFHTEWIGFLFYDLRYMCFCLLGSVFYLSEQSRQVRDRVYILLALAANLLFFQGNRLIEGDDTTYPNFFSQFLPLLFFVLLYLAEEYFPAVFKKVPSFFYRLAALVYPVYLTHVAVGLTAMYWLARAGVNRYLVVLIGFIVSFLMGKLISVIIEIPSARWARKAIASMRRGKEIQI